MSKPNFSIILPILLKPTDRFTRYGDNVETAVDLIEICGKMGIATGVEMVVSDGPTNINNENKQDIKAALEHHGLKPCSLVPYTFGYPFIRGSLGASDLEVRRQAIDTVKRAIDLAAEIGCPYVSQWPGQDGWDYYFEVDYQKLYEWWVTGMQELADHNPAIRLGLEPKPFEPRAFSFIDNPKTALLLINDIARDNVGVCLDIGHSLFGHESLAQVVALLHMKGNRLFHLHINDNYCEADWDMPAGSVHFIGLVEFYYWLQRTGYQGWQSVDIFNYRTDPPGTVLEGLKWMKALWGLVERATPERLGTLIEQGDGVAVMRFFRELLLA